MMQIKNNKVILRDMQASDIDDIIRWNTIDTEWMLWDAPWEHVQEDDFDWKDYCQKKLIQIEAMKQSDDLRTRFEVCINDETQTHIGYISHYFVNEQYKIDEQGEKIAIGMDICSPCYRGNGYGSNAYLLYIDYLRKHGYQNIYTQTW
ncbi:MAG: N-acetyltransferase, partial [Erysipelotrichia bacterium]|nr:N-acetyltransferase [Erysipelotrichia bacterium]